MKNKYIIILLILGLFIGSVPAYASENNATNIANIVDSYNSRLSWDNSVPRLDWKANEASMQLLQIIAHELDKDGSKTSSIDGADDSYNSRLSWDDSVPRLNWKADEASMQLLQIIAHELDKDGSNASSIDGADDSYNSRLSWDDSVPRLDWKADEASMKLLQICALLAENYNIQDASTTAKTDLPQKISQKKITTLRVKPLKKAVKLSWKKVKNAQGYNIQISLNKKFKKSKKYATKTYTVKTTTKKIKKLETKTYYVRVRSYA